MFPLDLLQFLQILIYKWRTINCDVIKCKNSACGSMKNLSRNFPHLEFSKQKLYKSNLIEIYQDNCRDLFINIYKNNEMENVRKNLLQSAFDVFCCYLLFDIVKYL